MKKIVLLFFIVSAYLPISAHAANITCNRSYGFMPQKDVVHVVVEDSGDSESEVLAWDTSKVVASLGKAGTSGERTLTLKISYSPPDNNHFNIFTASSSGLVESGVMLSTKGALSGTGVSVYCKAE